MVDLKPPSSDGSIVIVYPSTTPSAAFGGAELFEDVAGYEGEQRLIRVHFTDGRVVERANTLFVRTWRSEPGAGE